MAVNAFNLKLWLLDKLGHGNNCPLISYIAFLLVSHQQGYGTAKTARFILICLFKPLLCESVQCTHNNFNILNALERGTLEVLKYSHQIKILISHTIPVPSIETHCNAVILNQGYMYSYKSNNDGLLKHYWWACGETQNKKCWKRLQHCTKKRSMKRFICVETTKWWGLNPRPHSVLLLLCAHWGPKSPKRHKPVSKYTKHMTNYTFYCERVLISALRSIYLSLS